MPRPLSHNYSFVCLLYNIQMLVYHNYHPPKKEKIWRKGDVVHPIGNSYSENSEETLQTSQLLPYNEGFSQSPQLQTSNCVLFPPPLWVLIIEPLKLHMVHCGRKRPSVDVIALYIVAYGSWNILNLSTQMQGQNLVENIIIQMSCTVQRHHTLKWKGHR